VEQIRDGKISERDFRSRLALIGKQAFEEAESALPIGARGGLRHHRGTAIESAHIDTLPLPARSPNLNAHAERWVRSVKAECLSKIIPFGERPLRRAINDYLAHYHTERNHQGKNNVLLFRQITETRRDKPVRCRDRLGGLLRYYHRAAA
jgi:Integrase core domain